MSNSNSNKEKLTLNRLVNEYTKWVAHYGIGRSDRSDLRFGQFICNEFDVEIGNSYNEENAETAFKIILTTFEND